MHAAAQDRLVVHDGPAVDDAAHAQMRIGTHISLGQDHTARLQHSTGADGCHITDKHRCIIPGRCQLLQQLHAQGVVAQGHKGRAARFQ